MPSVSELERESKTGHWMDGFPHAHSQHPLMDVVQELTARVKSLESEQCKLLNAIREHHEQKADDRCIEDDDRLYATAGLPPCDRRVGSKEAMLHNCARFIENRCVGGGWQTYAELETERNYWRQLAEEHLERTADGAFLVECEHLYCPQCRGKVRRAHDLCYCDECGNPDCYGDPPLPLFYASTLAKP